MRKFTSAASATLTPGDDVFRGSDNSDIVATYVSNLRSDDWVAGGGGYDVVRLLSSRDVIGPDQFAALHSIEVLDASRATHGIVVTLDAHAVSQSGSGSFLVYGYDKDMTIDTAEVGSAGIVKVETSGTVTLADKPGEVVAVAGGSHGNISGGTGGDTIFGNDLSDRLSGGDGNDIIDGNRGSDRVYGGAGRDTIYGGSGNDTLSGGSGGDTFAVTASSGAITRITDFNTVNPLERLDLRHFTSATHFSDLTITSHNGDAVIASGTSRIVLDGVAASALKADDVILRGETGLNVFSIKAGTAESVIQEVVDEAPAGSVIELGAGSFTFTRTLSIERSDITLRGAGSGKTVIVSNIPDSHAGPTIKVAGEHSVPVAKLAESVGKGATSLVLKSIAGIKVGDVIHVVEPNDRAWLDSQGDYAIHTDTPPLRELLAKVTAISGHTVKISEKSPYAFSASTASVERMPVVDHVTVGGFKIKTTFGHADPDAFVNTLPAWSGVGTVEVDTATASKLYDIGIYDSASVAFLFKHVYAISGQSLHAEGSHDKGGDGNGYGFELYSAFSNRFSDLSDRDMRHGVLFSAWHAEHYNTISVSSTNRDINFHGSPDSGNTVTVLRSVMDFGSDPEHEWLAVSPGAYPKHPLPTISANDVTFKYLRSADRADTVHSARSGSDIATDGGNDRIYGGAGVDRIDGGAGDDVMSGGGSSDRFVRSHGDGVDTITDFRAGSGGDKIELDDYAFRSFTEIRITQQSAGAYVNLGKDGGILLKGVSASSLTSANFVLADTNHARFAASMNSGSYFIGSDDDDVLTMSPSALKSGATVRLGTGHDTVKVTAGDGFTLAASALGRFNGLDAIDVSADKKVWLTLTDSVVKQSDRGVFTIVSGSYGIAKLDVGNPAGGRAVVLDGRGTDRLADGHGHTVRIADDASVAVVGGDHADTIRGGDSASRIYGGAGDDRLSGGAGNDYLAGGSGHDAFVFAIGYDHDTIADFQVSADRLVLDATLLHGHHLGDFASQSGSNVVLNFGGGDVLTVDGVSVHSLSSWHVDYI